MNATFTSDEIKLITEIVRDWINEGIVIPPFDDNLEALFSKLGVDDELQQSAPENYPKTQERLSRPGVKR